MSGDGRGEVKRTQSLDREQDEDVEMGAGGMAICDKVR